MGKVIPSDLKIAKRLDGTSSGLFLAVATGQRVRNLLVVGFDTEQRGIVRRVFSILLTGVLVSQYKISAEDSRTSAPIELTSISYSRFELRDDQTGRTTGYDF